MANANPDTTAAKVESSSEPSNAQEPTQTGGQQNFGGGGGGGGHMRRGGGGGSNRFGNRRPGPYIKDENNFKRRQGGGRGMQSGQGNQNDHRGGGDRGQNDHRGGPNDHPGNTRNNIEKLNEKLMAMSGPTYDLPPLDLTERKFSGRNRLYVGNIGNEVTEDELTELFNTYGEVSELFINKEKNFAFIRVDYHSNAEKAKRELDGTIMKGRSLKIRFAPNGSTIKVKNLTPFVSNELLHAAFSVFGEVERALVMVDERGKPTGEGTVDFARKGFALNAIRNCTENCFFLTGSLRPCIVEMFDIVDDTDGYPERSLPKKNHEYMKIREVGPRFANRDTFEFEYGMRWKQMYELHSQKESSLAKEFEMEKEKLEAQMEFARYEHETEMLRDQLRAREMDRERTKMEWEMKERQAEEQRQRNEEQMRRQQEDMQTRMLHQEEEMRRRQQENNLFMQAHQLDNMLDQQEQAYEQPGGGNSGGGGGGGGIGIGGGGGGSIFEMPPDNNSKNNLDTQPFMNSYKRNNNHRFDGRDMGSNGPRGGGGGGRGGHWVNNDRRDDFGPKRRRF